MRFIDLLLANQIAYILNANDKFSYPMKDNTISAYL